MSTLKSINVIHPSGSTNNIVNDASGNVTIGNDLTVTGSTNLGSSIVVSTVTGGTGASSTLTLKSTSGVGTSDSILFKVGNNGATTAMTVDTSGNVGIGTASFGSNKFVVSGGNASFVSGLTVNTGRTVSGGTGGSVLASNGINNDFVSNGRNSSAALPSGSSTVRVAPVASTAGLSIVGDVGQSENYLNVYDNSFNTIFNVTAGGSVGIGTNSPTQKLDVYTGSAAYATITARNTVSGLNLAVAGTGSAQIVQTGAYNLDFATNNTIQMYIDYLGKLYCNGVYTNTVGATNRDVYVDNTGLLGYVSSVQASKTNISDITDASWLLSLNPVEFNRRKKDEDGNYTDEAYDETEYGLIAEAVEQVNDKLCFYDNVDGVRELRGVHYSKLVTPMLKLIQELSTKNDALEARLAALEAK